MFYLILAAVVVANLIWWWRTRSHLQRRALRIAADVWGGWQFVAVFAFYFSRRLGLEFYDAHVPRWLHATVLLWHLVVVLPWLLVHALRGVFSLVKNRGFRAAAAPLAEGAAFSRREFLASAVAFTPPLFTIGGAAAGEAQVEDFRIRRLSVPLAALPPELDGLTIAHVSDTHVGRFTRGKVLERIVEETNRLDADLVLFTGDLINDSLRAMPPALEMMRAFRARHGVVACEGNHDLIEDPTEFWTQALAGGVNLIRGDSGYVTIRGKRVQIFGLPWRRRARETKDDAQAMLARRMDGAFPILLAHHPHAWDDFSGIPLTLAGHTHGGQLMVNERTGAGPMLYRYWSGLYRREADGAALVVSNGTGNWFPIRTAAPAEIIHLTLTTDVRRA